MLTERVCLQLFPERLSEKVHATIPKGIVGGFEFSVLQRNLKELARKAMEMCFRVLKESNKSRFDSYSCQEQGIDHIPYCLSGLSRAHFSDNLSRNNCIHSPKWSRMQLLPQILLILFKTFLKYNLLLSTVSLLAKI